MSNDKPSVVLTTPALGFVEALLIGRYRVIRGWEQPSDRPFTDARALVCLGNEPLGPFLDRCPALGLIACYTTGYDAIDLPAARARGLAVTHAPGATSHAVAEYALALTLAALRNLVAGDRMVRAGEWKAGPVTIGRSLVDARLGIVGLGDIGHELGRLAQALGTTVAWWGPRPKPAVEWPRAATLLELATQSDVLAICARADESNRGLISAEVIDAVGPSGLIVNVARGQLIDETALIAALQNRRLGGAALDVFESEPTPAARWIDVPGVIATPHIGGASIHGTTKMTTMLLENLARYFSGEPLATPVAHS